MSGQSESISVWDMRLPSQSLNEMVFHEGQITALEWHPTKENYCTSGSDDGKVFVVTADLGIGIGAVERGVRAGRAARQRGRRFGLVARGFVREHGAHFRSFFEVPFRLILVPAEQLLQGEHFTELFFTEKLDRSHFLHSLSWVVVFALLI